MTLTIEEMRRLRESIPPNTVAMSFRDLMHFVGVARRDSAQPRGWLREAVPAAVAALLDGVIGRPPVAAPVTRLRELVEEARNGATAFGASLIATRAVAAPFDGLDADELDVVGEIVERLKLGKLRFGQLVVSQDERDFAAEARSELLDFPIWAAMASLRRGVVRPAPAAPPEAESEERRVEKPRRTRR